MHSIFLQLTTTANFTGNISITGTGYINVYGNAQVVFGSGVGVSAGQTIDFISANGNTNDQIIETSALDVSAKITGAEPGDIVTLENLARAAKAHHR